MEPKIINQEFGNTDLILIDNILKERFQRDMRILDAGCGEGRNMVYFIRQNYNIYGLDKDQDIITMAQTIGRSLNQGFIKENIIHSAIEENPFPDEFFNLVLCINVLHFSKDKKHFFEMVNQLIRILCPEGRLFIGMESCFLTDVNFDEKKNEDCYIIKGEERFLLCNELLREIDNSTPLRKIFPDTTLYIEGQIPKTYVWYEKLKE